MKTITWTLAALGLLAPAACEKPGTSTGKTVAHYEAQKQAGSPLATMQPASIDDKEIAFTSHQAQGAKLTFKVAIAEEPTRHGHVVWRADVVVVDAAGWDITADFADQVNLGGGGAQARFGVPATVTYTRRKSGGTGSGSDGTDKRVEPVTIFADGHVTT